MRAKHRGICSTNTSPLFSFGSYMAMSRRMCIRNWRSQNEIYRISSKMYYDKHFMTCFSCTSCNCSCWRGNIFTTRDFIMCIWPFPKRFWHNLFQTNHNTPLYITIQKIRMGLTIRRWIQNIDLSNSLQHWMNGPQHLVKFGTLPISNVLKLSRTLGYISPY